MRKRSLGVLAAGVAAALLLGGQTAATAEPLAVPLIQPDPLLMFPADPAGTDWAAVARTREATAQARRQRASAQARPYQEKEPAGTRGTNDTPATAEHIAGFGTGRRADSKIALTGDLRPDDTIPTLPPFPETDDAIGLAGDTGIPAARRSARTSGVIGDGPHGSAGDGTGDVDFYRLDGGPSGLTFAARTSTPTGDLDTMLALWDADGGLWAVNGDNGGSTDSAVTFTLQPNRTVYLMVGSDPFALPRDPKTPGTGQGVATEGPYDLLITSGRSGGDLDYYSFDLRAGDVLGASLAGGGTRLALYDPAGREVFGSSQDLTNLFAVDSPMPGGGNAVVDFVAPADGRYRIGVEAGGGPYDIKLEAFRPGTETAPRGSVHTIFLDFDGARVNTSIFGGGGGLRDLSPLSRFLPAWGLAAGDERALITAITATVRENLERDMIAKGLNPRFALRVLTSRDHADPWGQPNVSRVVVGGTIAETGIQTIGIAQSIDAGNFGREETALVLLDEISEPAGPAWSLNTYLGPRSDRIAFLGRAIGNITSHEAGHMSGSWHTDRLNDVHGIMDPGGNPAVMFAVGPDGIGGTSDDPDLDFTTDGLSPSEGFTGIEDTTARTAWAFVRGTA
ncbi:PPC domain-containing protein [Saccharothrix sp. S26]|uniref:PPC domain-containing protein n=1 Tax=Saccharothrix sp. S26 TaxID=2907215 RepID=UPI001F3F1FA3|nr:PPC domain-containing protein [Saccharothrix sp. S26]MCE6995570.1 PPC domain-containing protein [Saccharothrix sp. S26]